MPDEIVKIGVFGSTGVVSGGSNKANSDIESLNDAIKKAKATYDQKFMQLFTTKQFLTPILKNIIPEYKNYALKDIEDLITWEGDVDLNPAVYSVEDSGSGDEMPTHYDALFSCVLPSKEKVQLNLFFDLEMQRKNHPGYSIIKRGVYYCCRLISRQLTSSSKENDYDRLKPVYSVWILVNGIPKELQNTIYSMDLAGSFHKEMLDCSKQAATLGEDGDLIHLRLVYLSENFSIQEGQNNLIKYLQSVFANKVCDAKCNPYYVYSSSIVKEVHAMISAADAIEERGEQRGIAIGEQRGIAIGEQRGKLSGRIATLLEIGKTDAEIIQFLSTNTTDPLTEEEAIEALGNYRSGRL